MRTSRIKLLFEYAKEKNLLPLSGNELFHLQWEAFKQTKAFVKEYDLIEKEAESYKNEPYEERVKLWRVYTKKKLDLNNKYSRRAPAYLLNYFYSLLNNATKAKQIQREKINGRYIYDRYRS